MDLMNYFFKMIIIISITDFIDSVELFALVNFT